MNLTNIGIPALLRIGSCAVFTVAALGREIISAPTTANFSLFLGAALFVGSFVYADVVKPKPPTP